MLCGRPTADRFYTDQAGYASLSQGFMEGRELAMQKSGGKACEAEGTASTASRWWKPAGRTSGTAGLEGHE